MEIYKNVFLHVLTNVRILISSRGTIAATPSTAIVDVALNDAVTISRSEAIVMSVVKVSIVSPDPGVTVRVASQPVAVTLSQVI